MPINEGLIDRVIRITVGVILLAMLFVGPHTAWGWVGAIPLATGLLGFCPLYSVLGITTCRARLR